MNISHIGHATIHTPSNHDIHLRNILHVPKAQKNLISVHRLAIDNNAFIEFHPNYFLIKDQDMKNVILEGECRYGLYPFPAPFNKKTYIATKVPSSRWHSRLGHPSSAIVKQVISRNKLPLLGEASCSSVWVRHLVLQFVMLVNRQRVINSPTLDLIASLVLLWSSSSLMYGVLPLSLWGDITIM
jgi:hypothetical protein